ncbi:MAG TPA: BamA/TamA family outer membrane protein [Gemmatimonas sp.]|nr:BamA/TamA family outer membrane protein [Gemmatimonas sp.]
MRFHLPQSLLSHLALLVLALLMVRPARVDAQGARCDRSRRVAGVDFSGSPRFSDDTLAASIATQGGSWAARLLGTESFIARLARIDAPACADTLEVRRDALRIAVLHRQAGWFTASVTPRYVPDKRGVRILFDIAPGPEAKLDSLKVTGLPSAPAGRPPFDAPLRELQGRIFDRSRVAVTIDRVVQRLREAGYARAERGTDTIRIDTARASVTMTIGFVPGRQATLGDINVEIEGLGDDPATVDSVEVMRLVELRSGQRFRATSIVDAQRDLYRSEAFRFVLIDTQPPKPGQSDTTINLRIRLAEARTRYARAGLGWATLDCVRLQGRVVDRSFLGVGRRAELNVRMSKIGRGDPADFAPGICSPTVREDSVASVKLNYYAGISLSDTRLFGAEIVPSLTIYSERRGEPFTYLRETDIGSVIELTRQLTRRSIATVGLQYENGRTSTDPAESCLRFAQCRPEDYALSQFGRGVGIVSTAVTYDRTDDLVNPSAGIRGRTELRAGQTTSEIVSSLVFYRATGEGAIYRPLGGGVFAARLQLSRAFAPRAQLVDGSPLLPQQERLYAGGQNSVRGFQQNLLGPIIYVVDSVRTRTLPGGGQVFEVNPNVDPRDAVSRAVPRGGTALAVANLEYRHTLPGVSNLFQIATFVDVGNVWETQAGGFRRGDVRATPGIGLRLGTPLGPFRLDIGYQPYPPRAGRALYFPPRGAEGAGAIYCASPGNTVAIERLGDNTIFSCPESYRPPPRGVLSRLVFHFGLGQAF